MHRDEKGDTRHETGTGRRLNVYFYPWLVHRKRDRPLHQAKEEDDFLACTGRCHMDIHLNAVQKKFYPCHYLCPFSVSHRPSFHATHYQFCLYFCCSTQFCVFFGSYILTAETHFELEYFKDIYDKLPFVPQMKHKFSTQSRGKKSWQRR